MKTGIKDFLQLSSIECLQVYEEVLSNAERHYRIAQLLADGNEFGNAVSHLILGTEEHLKALILFLDAKKFEFRKIEGIKKLFHMHAPRHNLIKDIYSVWLVFKPFIERKLQQTDKPKRRDKTSMIINGLLNGLHLVVGGITGILNYQW